MVRAGIATIAVGVVFGVALTDPPIGSQTTLLPSPRAQQSRIEEDEPGWDCKTMGNRKCGPPTELTTVRR